MPIPADTLSQLFTLPPSERFFLAQQLLDSIDDAEAAAFDSVFLAELRQRREELLRGESTEPDWRSALTEIERSLTQPS